MSTTVRSLVVGFVSLTLFACASSTDDVDPSETTGRSAERLVATQVTTQPVLFFSDAVLRLDDPDVRA